MAPEKYCACLAKWQKNGDVIAENSLLKMLSGGPVLMVQLVNWCSVSGAVFSFVLLLWIHPTKIRQEKVFPKLYFWVSGD